MSPWRQGPPLKPPAKMIGMAVLVGASDRNLGSRERKGHARCAMKVALVLNFIGPPPKMARLNRISLSGRAAREVTRR
jgi:hypothetical protein